jgi:hypothetical protein
MTNKEKAELYRKVIALWKGTFLRITGRSYCAGLCRFFSNLLSDKSTNLQEDAFLRSELYKYKYNNNITDAFFWRRFDSEPRLLYLEMQLNHYQKLSENERT